jgi:hypothetical protein
MFENQVIESYSPMPRASDTQLAEAIMGRIRDHADFTGGKWGPDASQLAVWLGRPYPTVKRYVDRMVEQGTLELIGAKRWLRLTANGRRELVQSLSKSQSFNS